MALRYDKDKLRLLLGKYKYDTPGAIKPSDIDEVTAKIYEELNNIGSDLPLSGYKVIAGVIRNTGSGWESISGHPLINIDSISESSTAITIDHTSAGGSEAVTFIAAMDDFWAGRYMCGFAGGNLISQIKIYKPTVSRVVSLITHTGNGNFTAGGGYSVSYDKVTTGILTLTHPVGSATGNNIPKFWDLASTVGERTVHHSSQDSLSGTETKIVLLNMDGTQKNIANPDTNRFYIERNNPDITQVLVDPTTLTSTAGNIWIFGIVKI